MYQRKLKKLWVENLGHRWSLVARSWPGVLENYEVEQGS
jgi:hypothetical protein